MRAPVYICIHISYGMSMMSTITHKYWPIIYVRKQPTYRVHWTARLTGSNHTSSKSSAISSVSNRRVNHCFSSYGVLGTVRNIRKDGLFELISSVHHPGDDPEKAYKRVCIPKASGQVGGREGSVLPGVLLTTICYVYTHGITGPLTPLQHRKVR